jgi:hypothetical protein
MMRGVGVLLTGLLPVPGEVGMAYIFLPDNISIQGAAGSL